MVNRINENSYNNYTKMKTLDIPDTGEKFSLGYNQNELSSKLQDKKEEVSEKDKQAAEQSGVRLDISTSGRNADADRQKAEEQKKSAEGGAFGQMPLLESIRTFLTTVASAVRDLFDKIWNSPEPEHVRDVSETEEILKVTEIAETAENGETAEAYEGADAAGGVEAAVHKDEEDRAREIQQYLRKGDVEQAINILTENGKRTVARNSSIMTCYDRNGRVVEMNAHDRGRIFDGNRNARASRQ